MFEQEIAKVKNNARENVADNKKDTFDNKVPGKYSITEIKSATKNYGEGVLLDTDIFDGVHPRNWDKVLRNFVQNNLAGKVITVFNEDGTQEKIYFAKSNERVTKDGANNSHKVIDKLARQKGNVNKLMTIHIDEVLDVAKSTDKNNDNNHQWLDENGWEYKTVYVQTIKGDIYESTLNIAKTRDGRDLMYAFSNTKRVDGGVVPSTEKGRGSHTAINSYDSISQPDSGVKKYSLKDKITPDMDDAARYEILKDKKINIVKYNKEKLDGTITEEDFENLKTLRRSDAEKVLKKLGEEFGVFKDYKNIDMELEFSFSRGNLRESMHKQKGNFENYAKMMSVFTEVVENAVGIEAHNERYENDSTITGIYVFISAFADGNEVIPVKLEVKEFWDKKNTLYIAVSLEGIKNGSDFVVHAANSPKASDSYTPSTSTYSVADILKNVNSIDEDLLKYIPDGFLDAERLEAKARGIEKTKAYIETKNQQKYSKYSLKGVDTLGEFNKLTEQDNALKAKLDSKDRLIIDRRAISVQARKILKDFGSRAKSGDIEERIFNLYTNFG